MSAHEDYGTLKARITDSRHGDEKLAVKETGFCYTHDRDRFAPQV
jgi:hypothetical protein